MKRFAFLLSLASLVGCGDNHQSRTCGAGTVEENGVCVPDGSVPPTCTDGTILDTETNSCVIDPNACQNGTVLIGDKCVDPTEGLEIDVTEAAEPNGAGVIENSTEPAGILELKPIGQKLVIKGSTNPFQDVLGDNDEPDGQLDADYDTYFFEVTEPTLLKITTDGVGGTASAFLVLPVQASNPLTDAAWLRYGMNVTGDTSAREVYIPAPGIYALTIADTRSLYIESGSPPAAGYGGAAGGPNAFYYATVERLAIPTPTPVTLTDGVGMVTGETDGTIKFYSAPMGTGLASIFLDGDGPGTEGALAVLRNNSFKAAAQGPADIFTLGFRANDNAIIAADFGYHYSLNPQPYTLEIRTNDGTALVDGATSTVPDDDANDLFNYSLFYYDVDGSNAIVGLNVEWDQPVTGAIVDEDGFYAARFTGLDLARTFTTYNGLVRHQKPGRYYFVVFAPGAEAGDTITATQGDVAQRQASVIEKGTPRTDVALDAEFKSTAFTYTPAIAVDGWQQFLVSGEDTGNVRVRYYSAETGYGRLDDLSVTGGSATVDASPLFSQTFSEGTTTPQGRILLDYTAANYLVVATPATNADATVDIDFQRRENYQDVTVVAGTPQVLSDQPIDETTVQRYLVRSADVNKIQFVLHPDGAEFDGAVDLVDVDESWYEYWDDTLAGEDETGIILPGYTWNALVIYPVDSMSAAETFDLTLNAIPPFYGITSGATAFADACEGGTEHTFLDDPGSSYPVDDDGMTDAITLPAAFSFFGDAVTDVYVSTNGFLSFDQLDGSYPGYQLGLGDSDDPNNVIAPYWSDLGDITVCTKTVGTKFVIQWEGIEYDPFFGALPVQFQAILDSANNSIEFVYGAGQDSWADGWVATRGVENADATDFQELTDIVEPSTSRLFTVTP